MWLQSAFMFIYFLQEVQGLPRISSLSKNQMTESLYNKDIAFPSSSEEGDSDKIKLLVPRCKNNSTFCDDVEDYPHQLFRTTLKNFGKEYFKVENYKELLNNRHDSLEFICPVKTFIFFPKVAYNTKHEPKFIYNFENYRQGVSVSVCVEESTCKFFDKFIINIKSKCRQTYSERRLLSADDDGKPYIDIFKLPSGCACSYQRDRDLNFFS